MSYNHILNRESRLRLVWQGQFGWCLVRQVKGQSLLDHKDWFHVKSKWQNIDTSLAALTKPFELCSTAWKKMFRYKDMLFVGWPSLKLIQDVLEQSICLGNRSKDCETNSKSVISTLFILCFGCSGGATSSNWPAKINLVKVAFLVLSRIQSIPIKFHYNGWISNEKRKLLRYVLSLNLL